MKEGRSYRFTHALCRKPGTSIASGLRAGGGPDPDPAIFLAEHAAYVGALESAGASVTVLEALEAYPDSVFVEDAALCLAGTAIVLRPGAHSRFGEAAAITPALEKLFPRIVHLPGDGGFVDGGDILATDDEVLVGLSARTDRQGIAALEPVVNDLGYRLRIVETPAGVLHFKTDCGLLDNETVFATRLLAGGGGLSGYKVLECPDGEEAAANLVRFNDTVLLRTGFPRTAEMLDHEGYDVTLLDTGQAALVDGGLSCMSLRFSL